MNERDFFWNFFEPTIVFLVWCYSDGSTANVESGSSIPKLDVAMSGGLGQVRFVSG